MSCGYQGTLGFGYATALGVKVACPDRGGGVHQRRRRVRVRAAGADHRGHLRDRRGGDPVRQRRLRQRPARSAPALRGPRDRARGCATRTSPRSPRSAGCARRGRRRRRAARRPGRGARARRAGAHRRPGRPGAPRPRRGRCSCRAADEERARGHPRRRRDARHRGGRARRAAVHAVHRDGPGGLRVRDAARAAGPQRTRGRHPPAAGASASSRRRSRRGRSSTSKAARAARRRGAHSSRRACSLRCAAATSSCSSTRAASAPRARSALPARRRALRAQTRPARDVLHDRRQRGRPRVGARGARRAAAVPLRNVVRHVRGQPVRAHAPGPHGARGARLVAGARGHRPARAIGLRGDGADARLAVRGRRVRRGDAPSAWRTPRRPPAGSAPGRSTACSLAADENVALRAFYPSAVPLRAPRRPRPAQAPRRAGAPALHEAHAEPVDLGPDELHGHAPAVAARRRARAAARLDGGGDQRPAARAARPLPMQALADMAPGWSASAGRRRRSRGR